MILKGDERKKIDSIINLNLPQNMFLVVDICFTKEYVSSNTSKCVANTFFNVNFSSLIFSVVQH